MAASRFDTSPAFFTIEMAIWGTMIQHGSDFMRFYVATNPSVTLVVSTMGPFGAFQKASNPGLFGRMTNRNGFTNNSDTLSVPTTRTKRDFHWCSTASHLSKPLPRVGWWPRRVYAWHWCIAHAADFVLQRDQPTNCGSCETWAKSLVARYEIVTYLSMSKHTQDVLNFLKPKT